MSRLRRAEWLVEPVTHHEAVELVERVHYTRCAPNTSVARHGLRRRDEGKLTGVALWLPPTRPAALSVAPTNPRGVLALTRLALLDEVPTNGASFLLGAAVRLLDRDRWPVLLTYADTREGHTGAVYRAAGWRCLGPVAGSRAHGWRHPVTGEQRGQKRAGRNVSAAEMRAAGYERLPDAPKIKYTHEVTR